MSIHNRTRQGFAALLPVLALLVMAASNPQCARTQDHLTAPATVGVDTADIGACFSGCADWAVGARAAELTRFKAALAACGDNEGCRADAAATHVQNLHDINDAMRACMNGCHNQGSATGGN
jgi:hypothetical protein